MAILCVILYELIFMMEYLKISSTFVLQPQYFPILRWVWNEGG